MNILELKQNTPNWLAFRKKYIGASDAPIIMGKSPWTTPLQLWRRKLGFDPEPKETDAMKRGKELEPKALELAETLLGFSLFPIVAQSEKYPWMIASFDGYSPDFGVIVEIKCPGEKDHNLAKQGEIPEYYKSQLLHQMLVGNKNSVVYMSYYQEQAIFIDVSLNSFTQEEIDEHIKKTKDFYDKMITYVEPESTEKDYIHMEENPEWKKIVDLYIDAKECADFYDSQMKEYREKLIELSGKSNCTGHGLRLTKVISKGVVDWHSIEEIKHVNLENYRKPARESWRISI